MTPETKQQALKLHKLKLAKQMRKHEISQNVQPQTNETKAKN